MKPRPAVAVVDWLRAQDESELFLSVMTFAELSRGIQLLAAGKPRDALEAWVSEELSFRFEGRVLEVDRAVSEEWGRLMAQAERRGRPLSAIDGLIAATAVSAGLSLATRNVSDFESVDLKVINPFVG